MFIRAAAVTPTRTLKNITNDACLTPARSVHTIPEAFSLSAYKKSATPISHKKQTSPLFDFCAKKELSSGPQRLTPSQAKVGLLSSGPQRLTASQAKQQRKTPATTRQKDKSVRQSSTEDDGIFPATTGSLATVLGSIKLDNEGSGAPEDDEVATILSRRHQVSRPHYGQAKLNVSTIMLSIYFICYCCSSTFLGDSNKS